MLKFAFGLQFRLLYLVNPLWAIFGLLLSEIWAKFCSNHLVTLFVLHFERVIETRGRLKTVEDGRTKFLPMPFLRRLLRYFGQCKVER